MNLLPHQARNVASLRGAITTYGAALDCSGTGSGKTATALHTFSDPPLVVCPAVSVDGWYKEARKWGKPILEAISYDKLRTGKTRYVSKRGQKRVTFSWNHSGPTIFDEVHRCKGEKTQNSALLTSAPDPSLLLSATPFQSPMECKALGQKLKLFRNMDYWTWCGKYGVQENRFGYREWNGDLVHIKRIRDALADRMVCTPFHELAHLYNDNLVRDKMLTLTTKDLHEVNALREELEVVIAVTEQLKIRQKLEEIRLAHMIDDAQSLAAEGFRPVLMLNFRDTINTAFEQLQWPIIDGRTQPAHRDLILERWSHNEWDGLIVNTACAGESLNLHDLKGNAPRATLISPVFSGISRKQIHGRIHRNGAKSPALQTWYWIANTVEEEMSETSKAREAALDLAVNS